MRGIEVCMEGTGVGITGWHQFSFTSLYCLSFPTVGKLMLQYFCAKMKLIFLKHWFNIIFCTRNL